MNAVPIPDLRVGEPTRCGTLAIFPLFHERTLFPDGTLDYLLSHEAQEAGTCVIREVSEEGVVERLRVENNGTLPVLLLDGEILSGAKQDRVVRSSVLVGEGSQVVVPVYCVERGRWDRSLASLKTKAHSPPSLRHVLKGGSPRTGSFTQGDGQEAVWRFIQVRHRATCTRSPKENLCDVLRSRPDVVKQLRHDLQYPEGACGIVVVMHGKTIGIDLFDKPDSLQKVWDRLVVLGLTLDARDVRDDDRHADGITKAVGVYMESVRKLRWHQESTVGMGEMCRATGDYGSLATALVVDGIPIHVSITER